MMTIMRRLWRDRWVALVAYSVGSIAMTLLYLATFPAVKDQAQAMQSLAQSLPKGLVEAFQLSNFNPTFDAYFASKHMSAMWPIIVIFLAASLAGRALAGGVETGSIGLELSQPISRFKVFLGKYLGGVLILTVFIALTVLATPLFAAPFDVSSSFTHYWQLSIVAWLFTMSVYSLAMLASSIFSERSRVYAVTAAVLIVMYTAWLIGAIQDSYAWLKNISYFNYFDASKILGKGEISGKGTLIFLLSIAVFSMLAAWWWQRRDISV